MERLSFLLLLGGRLGATTCSCNERRHGITKDRKEAKVWLGDLNVAINMGYSAGELNEDFLNVTLADGRALRAPLWWYPRLANASPQARGVVELMPMGIHWPEIDEDISIASMLRGKKAPGAVPPREVA